MPSFVHTKVDPDRLRVAADNIESSLRMLENALGVVDEAILNSLKPTWSGEASSEFFDVYSFDSDSFVSLIRTFHNLNDQLKQAAGVYDRADDRAGELVSALTIG